MVSVHRARRCASPLGVVPVGLGDDAGDCHDANLLKERLFYFSFISFFLEKLRPIFGSLVLCCWILLDMLVAKREPTPLLGERLANPL